MDSKNILIKASGDVVCEKIFYNFINKISEIYTIFIICGAGTKINDELSGIWSIDELAPIESVSLNITVTVVRGGNLENTASLVSSFPEDIRGGNNVSTVEIDIGQEPCEDCGTLCNLFSPNGDGINDELILVCSELFPNNSLTIFDRYGNSVFESSGYDGTWDGVGENGELPKGTYYYILDLGTGVEPTKGWIQIVR